MSTKKPTTKEKPEMTQYKNAIREYIAKINMLNQIEEKRKVTRIEAVNLEGQISALTKAFDFDEKAIIQELQKE